MKGRTVSGLGLMSLLSAASLAATPPDRSAEEKSPFEVRILLDLDHDELSLQVVNRSKGVREIDLLTLDHISILMLPQGYAFPLVPLPDGGYAVDGIPGAKGRVFGRMSSPPPDPEGRIVRLRPGQSVGRRFSFCKHDVFGAAKPSVLKDIEDTLKEANAVRYKISVSLQVPREDREPTKSPRLESNSLLIDRKKLRALKAARARIDREKQ